MKALFTSLLILMASVAFSQSPLYTYVDADNNTYELFSGQIKYAPANGSAKVVNLTKVETNGLETLFKAAIDAKADRVPNRQNGASTIKFKQLNKDQSINLKSTSTAKNDLETALEAKVQ